MYFVYYINTLLTRSRLNSRFKKRTHCHFFHGANFSRVSDAAAADCPSQTRLENYRNISRVVIRFFSVAETPIEHSSLYNEFD